MQTTTIPGILTLHKPQACLPVIFDSPHSGRQYPADFDFACPYNDLIRIEDRYVDELFAQAPQNNAPLLCALFPRSYIDVNRAPDDIDENLLSTTWPDMLYGPIYPTSRSDSGIGLINRLIRPGTAIYNRPLSADEIMNRIRNHYEPYHDTLRTLIEEAFYAYGKVWHINCHSMPSASAYPKNDIRMYQGKICPADIVLGNRDGETCSTDFIHALKEFFFKKGFRVTLNDPYRGVELIRRYSQPTRGRHSLQIEINRSLFMDEETGQKRADFSAFKDQITEMIRFCTNYAQNSLTKLAAD